MLHLTKESPLFRRKNGNINTQHSLKNQASPNLVLSSHHIQFPGSILIFANYKHRNGRLMHRTPRNDLNTPDVAEYELGP